MDFGIGRYDYEGLSFANSSTIHQDTIWDILSKIGKKVVVIGVPMTYPAKTCQRMYGNMLYDARYECDYTYPRVENRGGVCFKWLYPRCRGVSER